MKNGTADKLFYIPVLFDFFLNCNKLICFCKIISVILGGGIIIHIIMENEFNFSFIRELAE